MLRLRAAIERASRRRWLGLLVALFVAFLLVFLVLHVLEHALDEEAALTCFVVVLLASGFVVIGTGLSATAPVRPLHRGPPRFAFAPAPARADHPPGSTPLLR